MESLIFTYALTDGGVTASLNKPYSVPPYHYSCIVAIALHIGWTLHGLGNRQFGLKRAILGLPAALLVWVIVSDLQSAELEFSRDNFYS